MSPMIILLFVLLQTGGLVEIDNLDFWCKYTENNHSTQEKSCDSQKKKSNMDRDLSQVDTFCPSDKDGFKHATACSEEDAATVRYDEQNSESKCVDIPVSAVTEQSKNDEDAEIQLTGSDKNRCKHATDELLSKIEKLSPEIQNNLNNVVNSLLEKTAHLEKDAKGTVRLTYKDENFSAYPILYVEPCIIQQPSSDEILRKKIDSMFGLVKYLKKNRPPVAVVINCSQVTLKNGNYKEGDQFELTGEILGKGNTAGNIIVAKDIGSNTRHAVKSILLSLFRVEEVKCWLDLIKTGLVPMLWLIRIEENKIHLHMEILEPAITLKDILDGEKYKIPTECRRVFALYIFKCLLSAVRRMHEKNWCHRDLHAGNVMIQKPLDIKIIDFGKANKIISEETGIDFSGKNDDILQSIRLVCALYCGEMFDSATDLRKTYKEKLAEYHKTSDGFFELVEIALNITYRSGDEEGYDTESYLSKINAVISKIDEQLKKENIDEIRKKVASSLFKEDEYTNLHPEFGSKINHSIIEKKTEENSEYKFRQAPESAHLEGEAKDTDEETEE